MDQGWAALVAGGFGLLGAVIGGAAAVLGARQQVRAQATAEHQHWSRQMRREAYESFITGAYDVLGSFTTLMAAMLDGEHEAARDQVKRKLSALLALGTRVALAGPHRLNVLAHQAVEKLDAAGQYFVGINTLDDLAASDPDPLLEAAARATDAFTEAAQLELQRPPR